MTLRAQDPPCPCDENTCLWTVEYGHEINISSFSFQKNNSCIQKKIPRHEYQLPCRCKICK